jgi:hypothetical protein
MSHIYPGLKVRINEAAILRERFSVSDRESEIFEVHHILSSEYVSIARISNKRISFYITIRSLEIVNEEPVIHHGD